MNIEVPILVLRSLSKKHEGFDDYYSSWSNDENTISIDTNNLSKTELKDITTFVEKNHKKADKDEKYKSVRKLQRRLVIFNNAMSQADTKILKQVKTIPAVVEGYGKKNLPNWVMYKEDDFENMCPYILTNSEYNPPDHYSSANATITFSYMKYGELENQRIRLETYELKDQTLSQILAHNGYVNETPELNEQHEQALKKWNELSILIGDVYVGEGVGERMGSDSYQKKRYYFKENMDNKVVMDFEGLSETNTSRKRDRSETRVFEHKLSGKTMSHVIHPYGRVFHLADHEWLSIHVDGLTPHKFKGEALLKKLILPEKDKELIGILMSMSRVQINDIVDGKQGGSFIMATGAAGTGKTLTAEVFSETVEKPLYKVQCSQLGLSVDDVEEKLKKVLELANRWGAILLIDEADVYVRAREKDINQNAIVGTFLRTLEYYTGILFMTSNMGTTIDDAILSRAIAHLEYLPPNEDQRMQIWTVLAESMGIDFGKYETLELAKEYNLAVGRDIKSLLKLGKMYADHKNKKCTIESIRAISGFTPNLKRETIEIRPSSEPK